MEQVTFRLDGVFEQLTTLFAVKAMQQGIELVYEIDDGSRLLVGDPLRLGQVLTNLVSNALKFSRQGNVAISVQTIAEDLQTVELLFSVRDEGIGMTPEQIANLFQPFSQADTSTTRRFGGTGLGLAISRQLVERMDGRIWAHSAPAQGSTFHFTARFPLAPGDSRQGGAEPAVEPAGDRRKSGPDLPWARFRGFDILMVEDLELNREVMQGLLANVGLEARYAGNGVEALDAVRHKRPDLILMDCHMPVMDGYEATRRLREGPDTWAIPIIALTANATLADEERCRAAGMNAHVAKPVRMDKLFERMAQCFPETDPSAGPARVPAAEASRGPAPTDLPRLPGIDMTAALVYVDGRHALLLRLIKRFRDSQGKDFEADYAAARAATDWKEQQRLAHSLKGVAKTLGATALAEQAHALELAAQKEDAEGCATLLPLVTDRLGIVMAGLADLDRDGAAGH